MSKNNKRFVILSCNQSSDAILKKVKKLALNSQLLTVQILINDVQVLILCLSYFITTVIKSGYYIVPNPSTVHLTTEIQTTLAIKMFGMGQKVLSRLA